MILNLIILGVFIFCYIPFIIYLQISFNNFLKDIEKEHDEFLKDFRERNNLK